VPYPFYQCICFMIFDFPTDLFVPIFYVLLESKTEWSYWHAIHEVLVACELKFEPGEIHCDFEKALINAVKDQFNLSSVTGCFFHWKQANRLKKMIKLGQNSI